MMDRDPDSRWSMEDTAHALGRLKGAHETHTREHTAGAAATAHFERPAPEPVRPTPTPAAAAAGPAAAATSAPPASASASGSDDRPSRRGVYAVVGALALLLVLGGIAYLSSQRTDDPADTASGDASDSASATPSDPPSSSAPESSAPSTSSATPSQSPTSASAAPAGAAAEKEQLLRDYFALAPGGSDEAWAMLGPSLQAQGRDRYDGFWRGISSVQVSKVRATDDSDSVLATLRYRTSDGTTSTERHRLGLIESEDGGYLIDTDQLA